MKKYLFSMAIAIAIVLILSLSVTTVQAEDQVPNQLMTQDQNPIRLQLKDRLHITDSAITLQQERLRTMDQTRTQFPDCENHWAQNQVTSGWAFGLLEGYQDGNFGPDKNVSGTEGLLITTRLMNSLSGIDAGNVTPGAVDWIGVPDWAKEQLQQQNALRLMTQTNYYEDTEMNRLHVAVMLAKGMALEPIDVPLGTSLQFHDQNGIPAENLGYVLALKNLGIINGYPDGTFQPNGNVTRAEISAMMVRVLELLQ